MEEQCVCKEVRIMKIGEFELIMVAEDADSEQVLGLVGADFVGADFVGADCQEVVGLVGADFVVADYVEAHAHVVVSIVGREAVSVDGFVDVCSRHVYSEV